jgi:hypothetical protein
MTICGFSTARTGGPACGRSRPSSAPSSEASSRRLRCCHTTVCAGGTAIDGDARTKYDSRRDRPPMETIDRPTTWRRRIGGREPLHDRCGHATPLTAADRPLPNVNRKLAASFDWQRLIRRTSCRRLRSGWSPSGSRCEGSVTVGSHIGCRLSLVCLDRATVAVVVESLGVAEWSARCASDSAVDRVPVIPGPGSSSGAIRTAPTASAVCH